jgi:hypothetical protein
LQLLSLGRNRQETPFRFSDALVCVLVFERMSYLPLSPPSLSSSNLSHLVRYARAEAASLESFLLCPGRNQEHRAADLGKQRSRCFLSRDQGETLVWWHIVIGLATTGVLSCQRPSPVTPVFGRCHSYEWRSLQAAIDKQSPPYP